MAEETTGGGSPAWPTLEEQLAQSHVVPGSALAELIAANQDFSILRPEEAHDRLGLPPWLRVYWQKNHPDYTYIPGDPSGGYPLALKDMYIWMVRNQSLKPKTESPGN
jgi:hypothetical protein